MTDIFSRECPFTGQICIMRACEKACCACRGTDGAEGGEFRWLIEAPGQRYLSVQRLSASDNFEWTNDHDRALKFVSQMQADALMMALRQLDRELDSLQNNGKLSWGKLFAFETTLGNARAVEHAWMCQSPREVVARWMMTHGYATGHGDTLINLLGELETQASERAAISSCDRQ